MLQVVILVLVRAVVDRLGEQRELREEGREGKVGKGVVGGVLGWVGVGVAAAGLLMTYRHTRFCSRG